MDNRPPIKTLSFSDVWLFENRVLVYDPYTSVELTQLLCLYTYESTQGAASPFVTQKKLVGTQTFLTTDLFDIRTLYSYLFLSEMNKTLA
jgi:hypothetical protein